ncbi:hypothetical protein BRADI_4g28726v3 [Brachypodium distachyon]|uniref:Uncharacterized protein n=1 Tax=Brachypodium distachyon TaxID=15368 RepID=A0A2K2CQX8_BRADI|nr:hypothetical protein BRADI_4g28726v3 [Brachypodium distachyon]
MGIHVSQIDPQISLSNSLHPVHIAALQLDLSPNRWIPSQIARPLIPKSSIPSYPVPKLLVQSNLVPQSCPARVLLLRLAVSGAAPQASSERSSS